MQRAVIELPGRDAAASAIRIHDQIEREILDEELSRVTQRLAVERMQNGVAGAVGGGAGALDRRFAVILGHAAKGALIDLAFIGARERHAPMFKLVNGGGRVAAEIFDGVLIAEPVRPLHGVVHVPAPIVLAHIAERGGDAALRRDGVRARREDFRDAGGFQPGFSAAKSGAQAGPASADHHDIVIVVDPVISGH